VPRGKQGSEFRYVHLVHTQRAPHAGIANESSENDQALKQAEHYCSGPTSTISGCRTNSRCTSLLPIEAQAPVPLPESKGKAACPVIPGHKPGEGGRGTSAKHRVQGSIGSEIMGRVSGTA